MSQNIKHQPNTFDVTRDFKGGKWSGVILRSRTKLAISNKTARTQKSPKKTLQMLSLPSICKCCIFETKQPKTEHFKYHDCLKKNRRKKLLKSCWWTKETITISQWSLFQQQQQQQGVKNGCGLPGGSLQFQTSVFQVVVVVVIGVVGVYIVAIVVVVVAMAVVQILFLLNIYICRAWS